MSDEGYRVLPIPIQRRFALDAGRLGRGKNTIHGLAEVDVTTARAKLRDHEERTGEKLSFTGFVINCLGEAIDRNREMQAYRDWRGRLVLFDDVNVSVMIEAPLEDRRVPMPYVIKAVNRKPYRLIHEEIRAVQSRPAGSEGARFMRWFLVLPGFIRRTFYWVVLRVPRWFRAHSSSVLVTAVGMFSRGAGWGIPNASNTLTVTLGGIAEKPGIVEDRIEPRQYLHLTISVDHDVVDGAPTARFAQVLLDLIEGDFGL